MTNCLVSFGANIGNALKTIEEASDLFRARLGCDSSEYSLSPFYKTPPVGGPVGQPPFVNAVVAFTTDMSVWQVWQIVRDLELHFGRERNQRWEARKLDMDILLFGDQRIWTPHLKVPHPRMCMRRFILLPAQSVAPSWICPVSNWTISQLALNLSTPSASLLVQGFDERATLATVIEAGRQARAEWRRSQVTPGSQDEKQTDSCDLPPRWISATSGDFETAVAHQEKRNRASVLVCLANELRVDGIEFGKHEPSQEGAWEDRLQRLARRLNLTAEATRSTWPIEGPRYLLDGTDVQWAIHELVAAFDAMDCPVEPIVL